MAPSAITPVTVLTGFLGSGKTTLLNRLGLVSVAGEAGPHAVHAVQHALYPPARLAAWPDADRDTRIVIIGRDLEERPIAQILDSFTRTSAISPR